MRLLIISICFLVFSGTLHAVNTGFDRSYLNPDSTYLTEENINRYTMADSILDKLPFRNQNNLNRIFPGVVSYFQDFYIRGSESYETSFFIEGVKFNDLFTGKNSFFINPNVFEKIDFYNGLIPTDLGNTSSGLFNYKLHTGGDKISFEAEHMSDNITFSGDPYSGKKRLGSYFYGYNETNIGLSGPLYFDNVKFYTNINYLFQRDKNPQRYPGIDRQFNNGQYYPDTLQIYLPAGIVKLNSLESFTSVSTLDIDLKQIKIRAFGIYFDENTFVERNHILQYLNPRSGLIDRNGAILNVKLDHQLNEILAYSVSANYSFKSELTTDEFLGDDYWSYGDSVANANAGVIWERKNSLFGRYQLPLDRNISGWAFESYGYPYVEHKKSEQGNFSINTKIKTIVKNHNIILGGDINIPRYRYWYIPGQRNLAKNFYNFRSDTNYYSYTDNQIKEMVLTRFGVYNIGYTKLGNKSNLENDNYLRPLYYSLFINDYFSLYNTIFVDLGLRLDHLNSDQKVMIDPSSPEKTINYITGEINPNGLKTVGSYQYFSPRLLISSLELNNTKLFISYSQNIQAQPLLITSDFDYSGYQLMIIPNSNFVGGTLRPLLTKIFELGSSISLFDRSNLTFTYFNKRTSNRQTLDFQETNQASPFRSYYYFSDSGKLDASGFTISFTHNFNNLFLVANFNYQNANELVNKLDREDWLTPFGNKEQEYLESEKSNSIFFNALFSYDFSALNKVSDFFSNLTFSGLLNYQSGHPIRQTYRMNYSTYQAFPETTPSTSQIDLKIEKRFQFLDNFNVDFYIYIINLFDTKNIYDVFSTTGSVENDGQLIEVPIYGDQIKDLHKLLNAYNPDDHQQTFYGPPRQICFGIKLNY